MEEIRIALVQMQVCSGKVKENIKKMGEFVKEASRQKAEIVCFPELCIQGYNWRKAPSIAESIPGESSLAVSRLAQEARVIILAGLAEKSNSEKPFITQLVAFPDGRLDKYRKTHLGKSELPYFTPGNDFPVFSVAKARFGIQICWDLHFPEVTTIFSLRGTEIIFAPHASPSIVGDRRDIWLKYLSARAYDNAVFIAACNLVGDDGDNQKFCGGALIIDPKGNVVAEVFNGREELLVADLNPTLINTIRLQESSSMRNTFYLKVRRPELYKELVKY